MKRPIKRSGSKSPHRQTSFTPHKLRIIAGVMGGRKIEYNGDPATRPMKDRTREAVFSLLGGYLNNMLAIDLFGGTGVLTFESVSRGAVQGVILELSRVSVSAMLANMRALGLEQHIEVHNVDTLRWLRAIPANTQPWMDRPWVVFCCPPYKMWGSDAERLAQGLQELYDVAPLESQFVCETEVHFDLAAAIPGIPWDIRKYSPATIGVAHKTAAV